MKRFHSLRLYFASKTFFRKQRILETLHGSLHRSQFQVKPFFPLNNVIPWKLKVSNENLQEDNDSANTFLESMVFH